jgi:hypothetical protein
MDQETLRKLVLRLRVSSSDVSTETGCGATPSASVPNCGFFYPVPEIVTSRKILKVEIPDRPATI